MGPDDDIRDGHDENVLEQADRFKDKETINSEMSGVYGIYSTEGECLYVGESKNLLVRLNDHFYRMRDGNFKQKVESDQSPPIDPENLLQEIEVKRELIAETEDRKSVEEILIVERNPRYNVR